MRKTIIAILFLNITTFCIGQKREDYYIPKLNKITKNIKNLPGTTKLNDSLFIDSRLVDNIMYLEFLNSVKYFWNIRVSDSIQKLPLNGLNKILLVQKFQWMPVDSLLFNQLLIDKNFKVGEKIDMNIYLYDPKYQYYPIVNITKEQAEMYCKWRSDMVNIIVRYVNNSENKKTLYNITYRLPTLQELNEVLSIYGHSKKLKKRASGIPFYPMTLDNRSSNKTVIFNENNLSEFTFDSKLFGSNWTNSSDLKLPSNYIGFRCICEINK